MGAITTTGLGRSAAIAVIGLLAASCAGGSDDAQPDSVPNASLPDTAAPPADALESADEPPETGAVDAAADTDTEATTNTEDGENDEPTEAATRWEDGDSAYLFDQSQLHTYELTIPEEDLAFLDADPAAEEYVEGSLTFEGETLDAVGIRYKGSVGAFLGCTAGSNPFVPSGEKTCSKLSMKIKVNWDDSKMEFYGLRRLQFHAMNLDPTLMHDRLGYWMFEQAGVAGPRSTHARLVINGEFAGLFAMTEQIDGRLTRDRFDDGTGNLYKEVWPFVESGEIRDEEALIDGLRTNEDDDPTADIMREFAREILDTGAPSDPVAARAVLDTWTDLDAFVAYAVVDRLIAHEDGPFHWYCIQGPCEPHNFFFYEDPTARRVHIIPWDLDNAFDNMVAESNPITPIADEWGETRNDCEPFPYGSFDLRQRSAACDPLVAAWALLTDDTERIRSELLAGPLSIDEVLARLDEWSAQIAPVVAEAAGAFDDAVTVGAWNRALDTLRSNLTIALEI